MSVEVLAARSWTGCYDITGESRLVKRKDKFYLVHDEFCGTGSLDGGTYRPFVYAVPDAMVNTVLDALTGQHVGLEDVTQDLECYGRQSSLSWAGDL